MAPRSHRFVAVLAVVLLGAACSSGSGDSSPTSGETTTEPPTTRTEAPTTGNDESTTIGTSATVAPSTTAQVPLDDGDTGLTGQEAELTELRLANGGRLPVDAALDFFAAGFGPVAGADPDRFEFQGDTGTMAVMGVLGHWDALSPEQQDDVRRALGYPRRNSLRARPGQIDDPELLARLQTAIDEANATLAARLGLTLPFPAEGELWGDIETPSGSALAVAIPERGGDVAPTGAVDRCRLAFVKDPFPTPTTVAHEVFHCYQYAAVEDVADVLTGERWIVEGSAEWAGAEVAGVDDGVKSSFEYWVHNTYSVFGLAYSAVGFYWAVESLGVDLWPTVLSMHGKAGVDAVTALGVDPGAALDRVATSLARRNAAPTLTEVDPRWDFADPEVPQGGVRDVATVTLDEPYDEELPRGGYVRASIPVLQLEGGERAQVLVDADVGTIQFFGKEAIPYEGGLNREFCLEPGGCTCGASEEVDSGLEEGSRDLILGAGELGSGPMSYIVRIPDPEGAFTDGTWRGTITSSYLSITGPGETGQRTSTDAPFELTIENGAVVSGAYSLSFGAQVNVAAGAGFGVATISGTFTGCGFSPQMKGTSYSFNGTLITNGAAIPLEFSVPGGGTGPDLGTFWVPDPVTAPNGRTGVIDASPQLAAIGSAGFSASGMEITFHATKAA